MLENHTREENLGEPRAVFYRTLIDSMTLTKYFVCLREHLVS